MNKLFNLLKTGFVESASYSLNNLVLVIFFGLNHDYVSVYAYGMSLTVALVFLSVLRQFVLLPYSLEKINLPVMANYTAVFLLVSLTVGSLFVFLFNSYASGQDISPLVFLAIMFYNMTHEVLRYVVVDKLKRWFAGLTVAMLLTNFILVAILKSDVSGVAVVCFGFALIEILLLFRMNVSFQFAKMGSLNWSAAPLFIVLSQVSLVHMPFVYLSFIANQALVAKLFVLRSMFQGVQVMLRALETTQQKALVASPVMSTLFRTSRTNLLVAFVFGLLSYLFFLLVCFILGKKFDAGFVEISSWFLIFLLLSVMAPIDTFLRIKNYISYIVLSYFVGAIVVFTLSFFIGDKLDNDAYFSLFILLGWMSVTSCAVICVLRNKGESL